MTRLFATQARLPDGWQRDVLIDITDGRITAITPDADPGDAACVDTLLPALGNLHSHSFQRAMAGMTEVRAKGPALVCITRGGDGVTGHAGGDPIAVAAKRVEVVDTVGAGDTFNAGFLASLYDAGALSKGTIRNLAPDIIREAVALGAAAAAVTVSRAGANPPTRDEL